MVVSFALLNPQLASSQKQCWGVPTRESPKLSREGAGWGSKERSTKRSVISAKHLLREPAYIRWEKGSVLPGYVCSKGIRVGSLIKLKEFGSEPGPVSLGNSLDTFQCLKSVPENVYGSDSGSNLLGKTCSCLCHREVKALCVFFIVLNRDRVSLYHQGWSEVAQS